MFGPVEVDGRVLVDGFLAAPVPVDALRKMGADVVIAIFLEAANNRKPTSIVDVIGPSVAILQRHADLQWRRTHDIVIEPVDKGVLWDCCETRSKVLATVEHDAVAALANI